MLLASWNLNSLKQRMPRVEEFLAQQTDLAELLGEIQDTMSLTGAPTAVTVPRVGRAIQKPVRQAALVDEAYKKQVRDLRSTLDPAGAAIFDPCLDAGRLRSSSLRLTTSR